MGGQFEQTERPSLGKEEKGDESGGGGSRDRL